jgi:DNA-binding NarL/FixJ family response regulator
MMLLLDPGEVKLLAIVSGGVQVTISSVDEHDVQCVLRVVSTTADPVSLDRPHELDTVPDGLTGREREVASLLALGLSNRRIAEQLVIAEKTVKNHVQRVLEKLGARSRAEVAARAGELGLQRRQVAHALF